MDSRGYWQTLVPQSVESRLSSSHHRYPRPVTTSQDPREKETGQCYHHRESLPTPCLSIREDRPVIPIQNIVDGRLDTILEYILLLGTHIKTAIKCKRMFPRIVTAL